MAAFIAKQLEKILARKELKSKTNEELRNDVQNSLEAVQISVPKNGTIASTILPQNLELFETPADIQDPDNTEPLEIIPPELYLNAICKATRSGIPPVQTLALDALQKLIAFGQIAGNEDALGWKRAELVISSCCDAFTGTGTDEQVSLQLLKVLLTAVTSQRFPVHDQTLLLLVKTAYNVALASKSLVNQQTARAALTQTVNLLFSRMEAEAIQNDFTSPKIPVKDEPLPEPDEDQPLETVAKDIVDDIIEKCLDIVFPKPKFPDKLGFQSQLQKDCWIVIRALCRLSQKSIDGADPSSGPSSSIDPKSHELRSKVLSLQLIKSALQQAGPVFKTHPAFIMAVRQFLCVAMSRNGLSPVQEVFELSIAIILHLLHDFRTHLKSQIEAFFSEIFLALLEAQSTAPAQRLLVVQAMTRVCNNAQLVTDLYVNYDCGMKSVNVFEKLVNILIKIASDRSIESKVMRACALECVINILKCMVEWSRELYVCPGITPSGNLNKEENVTKIKDAVEISDEVSERSGPNGIEQLKETKAVLEQGIAVFNKKPGKGIKMLTESKMIESTPEAIAEFLHEEGRLDLAMVGDYLGDPNSREIMYAYVDMVDMTGLDFVHALRSFLESFQLPGEAQKVDRLMEKFAARYVECNQTDTIFASADAAYVLAFSIIMLATDLHSNQIKKKMTVDDYIKMNRGVNEQSDLPREYLENVYNQVAEKPLLLRGGRQAKAQTKGGGDGVMTDKEKQNAAKIERTQLEQSARAALEEAAKSDVFWSVATDPSLPRSMFKSIWTPTLAALSRTIQEETLIIKPRLCLDGLQCGIRLAGIFDNETARQSYIQALTRFSLLQPATLSTANETITSKNIEAIKALLAVAITCGNYLGSSWSVVLRCVSKLELLQLVGQGVPDVDLSHSPKSKKKASRHKNKDQNNSTTQTNFASLTETSQQSIVKAVDTIFTRSCGLQGDAIVHFATALVEVSNEELKSKVPRMFSLQKLVEISYYNMGRVRFQWTRFWNVVGDHFQRAGCSQDVTVSTYALDSLRQISLKLEKALKNIVVQPFTALIS